MSKIIGVVDSYKCTVSADIAKIGAEELREDENIRSQSLENFREWILKNENILKCRLDSAFLLRFLRVKKYSLPLAQEVLMKHLALRAILPEYFHNMDCLEPGVDKMFSQGTVIMLKGRDDNGRRVLFFDYEKIKPTKEDITAAVKAYAITFEVLLGKEDNQITGINIVVSCKGLGLSHLPLFSPTFLQTCSTAFYKAYPMRIQNIHIAFMPSFLAKTMELVKYFLGPKMGNRVTVHGAEKTLNNIIPKRMLPLEHGGETCTVQELISTWKEEMLENQDILLSLDQIAIDEKYKMKRVNDTFQNWGTEGSFRQLQID